MRLFHARVILLSFFVIENKILFILCYDFNVWYSLYDAMKIIIQYTMTQLSTTKVYPDVHQFSQIVEIDLMI